MAFHSSAVCFLEPQLTYSDSSSARLSGYLERNASNIIDVMTSIEWAVQALE